MQWVACLSFLREGVTATGLSRYSVKHHEKLVECGDEVNQMELRTRICSAEYTSFPY